MSFIPPPFLSDNLSEPSDSLEELEQRKVSAFQQLQYQLLHVLRPKGLYQRIGRFRTREYLAKVAIRSHFDGRLEKDWQRLKEKTEPLSLLLCELDNFAYFRRKHGDVACNNYLGQVANVIYANIERPKRPKGMLARYQGDTFAVLLPHTSIDEAACIAKKIRLRVKALQNNPRLPKSIPNQAITLSLGISTIVPTAKLTPANLVAAAEQSLRQAQRAGGNRVILQEGGR